MTNRRPGDLAHTTHGEPLARSFFEELVADRDHNMNPLADGDGSVYMLSVAITVQVNVLLGNAGAVPGMRWTIVRPSSAVGASGLNVRDVANSQDIASLTPAAYAEVVFTGARWSLIGLGTLPP